VAAVEAALPEKEDNGREQVQHCVETFLIAIKTACAAFFCGRQAGQEEIGT